MKKFLIIILACLLLVSCATTKYTANNTEDSEIFKTNGFLHADAIEIVENKELRKLFDKFNAMYFDDFLTVDYIGYVDAFLLQGKGNSYYFGGSAFWKVEDDEMVYGIAMINRNDFKGANATTKYFNGVLIHEMTHLYFYQKAMYEEGHGENFRNKIDELYEINPQFEKVYD